VYHYKGVYYYNTDPVKKKTEDMNKEKGGLDRFRYCLLNKGCLLQLDDAKLPIEIFLPTSNIPS
jgi:hypothetical protein